MGYCLPSRFALSLLSLDFEFHIGGGIDGFGF